MAKTIVKYPSMASEIPDFVTNSDLERFVEHIVTSERKEVREAILDRLDRERGVPCVAMDPMGMPMKRWHDISAHTARDTRKFVGIYRVNNYGDKWVCIVYVRSDPGNPLPEIALAHVMKKSDVHVPNGTIYTFQVPTYGEVQAFVEGGDDDTHR
jgi:hypothetical protein